MQLFFFYVSFNKYIIIGITRLKVGVKHVNTTSAVCKLVRFHDRSIFTKNTIDQRQAPNFHLKHCFHRTAMNRYFGIISSLNNVKLGFAPFILCFKTL